MISGNVSFSNFATVGYLLLSKYSKLTQTYCLTCQPTRNYSFSRNHITVYSRFAVFLWPLKYKNCGVFLIKSKVKISTRNSLFFYK